MTHLTAHQTAWLIDLLDRESPEHTGSAVPDDPRIQSEVLSAIAVSRALGSTGALCTVQAHAHDGRHVPATRWQADRIGPMWYSVREIATRTTSTGKPTTDPETGEWVAERSWTDLSGEVHHDTEWFSTETEARQWMGGSR